MSRKPKILYVIDTLNTGGAETSLVDLAIQNKEADAVFVTIYQGEQLKQKLIDAGIPVYQLNLPGAYDFKKARRLLLDLLKEIQPDVIHASLLRSELIVRPLAKKMVIPLIGSFVSNSYSPERYAQLPLLRGLKLKFFQYLNRRSANLTNHFISNSESIKQANAKALNIAEEKISVIYRGRKAENYRAVSPAILSQKRQSLNLKSEDFIFLSVGRLIQSKGHQDIIQAFEKVHRNFPKTKLLIAGEGPYRDHLHKLIDDLSLNQSVILLGNRDDVPTLLQLADSFVFASYLEGLPGALIEAMFSKKIIIASNIPENLECVSNKSALIFDKSNKNQLSQLMTSAIKQPDAYQNLAENAYQTALDKFDLNKIIHQYNEVYQNIILSANK